MFRYIRMKKNVITTLLIVCSYLCYSQDTVIFYKQIKEISYKNFLGLPFSSLCQKIKMESDSFRIPISCNLNMNKPPLEYDGCTFIICKKQKIVIYFENIYVNTLSYNENKTLDCSSKEMQNQKIGRIELYEYNEKYKKTEEIGHWGKPK